MGQIYFYVKAGLELMLVMTFVQLCVNDTRQTRDVLFRAYVFYVVVITGLSLYMAIFPSDGSRQLDSRAIRKYCEELSETGLFYFEDIDECLTESSLHLRQK